MKPASSSVEPFTCMDFLFAHARRPMLIIVRIHVEALPDADRLREELKTMVRQFPRFRSVVEKDGRWLNWRRLPLEDLDWGYHVQQAPAGWGLEQLEAEGLDPAKPRWKFILGPTDSQPFIFAAFDHVIGDGVSMSEVLFRLCGGDQRNFLPPRRPRSSGGFLQFLARVLLFAYQHFLGTLWVSTCEGPNGLRTPPSLGRTDVHRFSAPVPSIPLEDVKRCKDLSGLTVSEILIACAALATRRALRRLGDDRTRCIRLSVGANMRAGRFWDDPQRSFGNQALNFFFPLALAPGSDSSEDVCRRLLQQVRQNLGIAMMSKVAEFTYWFIVRYFPWLGLLAVRGMHDPRNDKATLWIAPIVGPSEAGRLAGKRVLGVESFSAADLPLYCGFVSYAGEVKVSFTADPRVLDEEAMRLLTESVKEELDTLKGHLEASKRPLALSAASDLVVGTFITVALVALAVARLWH